MLLVDLYKANSVNSRIKKTSWKGKTILLCLIRESPMPKIYKEELLPIITEYVPL